MSTRPICGPRPGRGQRLSPPAHGRQPRLDVVIVGDHPASRAYVRTKTRMAHETAIDGHLIELPETIGKEALLGEIARLNADPAVDGILVQLPLPGHLDGQMMIDAIRPEK